jgi:VWFA-related protein
MTLERASRPLQRTAFLCVLLIIACVARPRQSPQPKPNPVIVADTEEVSLDLAVRDKRGRLVKDLKPEDLKISDAGATVKISSLRLVTAEADSGHFVTLLYDRLDASAGQNARDITGKLLKLQPAMRVSYSVFGISDRMRLLQAYTADASAVALAARVATGGEKKSDPADLDVRSERALVESVEKGVPLLGKDASLGAARDRMLAKTTLTALQETQHIVQDQHARPALAGLLGLVRAQRDLPGRKVIIYFARGWQSDAGAKDMIRSITGAANRAGVSIYTVDANALDGASTQVLLTSVIMAPGRAAAQSAAASPRNYGQNNPDIMITPGQKIMTSEQMDRFSTSSSDGSPLDLLARQTGGQYIAGADNPKKPLHRMFEDMAAYYEASYVPPPHESDGQFRPVSVTSLRRDVVIQARSGYFALPPATGSGIRPFEAPLIKILEHPNLPSDIRFHADVLRMGDIGGRDSNALVVEVPMDQIELSSDANTNLFSGRVSIVAQIKDASGAVAEHFSEDVPRHGALEALERARTEVITMQRHFSLPPGDYKLEAVVMDRNSGKTGGYRQLVKIGNPETGPALSDIVLVRRESPYNAQSDRAEPLSYESSRIIPSLSPQLPEGLKTISLFFILHPDAKLGPPTLELAVTRDGEPIMRGPLQLHGGAGAVPYLASLRSASLEPGEYQVSAILTQGGEAAQRSIAFTIPGGKPTAESAKPKIESSMQDSIIGNPVERPKQRMRAALTMLSADGNLAAPSIEQQRALIEDARARALGYIESLPNFVCVEVTDRSVDAAGNGSWRHRDSMAELVRYHSKHEERVTLEVNGQRSDVAREDMQGAITHGEFGGLMASVFRPEAKAEFRWKQAALLGNGNAQVFAYSVSQPTSDFAVIDVTGRRAIPAFHGLVYVDEATRAVRRITLESDALPDNFVLRSSAFSVDYDYVAIGSHEYLMPVSGTVTLHRGKRAVLLNEMEFRDYRKYGSQTSIEYR